MPALPLSEITRQIEDELQYAPDLASHRIDILAVINRQYDDLCRSSLWPWLIREQPLHVFPDFTIDNAEIDLKQSGGSPASFRIFLINNARLYDDGKMYLEREVNVYQHIHDALLGAEFGLDDMSLQDEGNGNWGEGPFVIDRLNPTIPTIQFYCDPRCKITDVSSATGDYRFAFPRWRLQGDVDEVLEIFDHRGMRLEAMDMRNYIARMRQASTVPAGTPRGFVMDEGMDPRFPPLHASYPLVAADDRSMLSYQRQPPPIENEITAASTSGSGVFVDGQTYRFAVSWMYSGMFGPLSNVVTHEQDSTGSRVTLSNLDLLLESTFASEQPETDFGWQLAIWWGQGETGPLYLFDVRAAPTNGTGMSTVLLGNPILPYQPGKRVRYDEAVPALYRHIRLWPRPDSHQELTVRYHARPPQLLLKNETPQFHEAFHPWLVWAALCDMSSRFAGSEFHKRCAMNRDRIFRKMLAYYQPGKRLAPQKGMIGQRRSGYPILGVTYNVE